MNDVELQIEQEYLRRELVLREEQIEAAMLEEAWTKEALAEEAMVEEALIERALLQEEMLAEEEYAAAQSESTAMAYALGVADVQEALRATTGGAEGDALAQEDAYQLGVAFADARVMMQDIEAHAKTLSPELKEFYDKGVADVEAAVQSETKLASKKPAKASKTTK